MDGDERDWPTLKIGDEDLMVDWWVFTGGDGENDPTMPPVAVTLRNSPDGRMICTGLIVGLSQFTDPERADVEVTSRALRRIPVAELIGRVAYAASGSAVDQVPETIQTGRTPGPRGHSAEHFESVAQLYRHALEINPKAPVAWMTERLGRDRSTVTRWLQRARDKGYLGDSIPGRAGESPRENG